MHYYYYYCVIQEMGLTPLTSWCRIGLCGLVKILLQMGHL